MQLIVDGNVVIDDNKITGILGPVNSGKSELSILLSKQIKENKVGIISHLSYSDMLSGNIYDFIKEYAVKYNYKLEILDKRIDEVLRMVGLLSNILKKDIFNLSKSEKIKLLLCRILLYNPELIILDSVIEELDFKTKNKLFKLLIKLKKFYNKTVIITASNIDNIYELIDNLIIIYDKKVIALGNKYEVYEEKEVMNNNFIDKPIMIEFKSKLKKYGNIDIGNNDSINELIKAIYREVR